ARRGAREVGVLPEEEDVAHGRRRSHAEPVARGDAFPEIAGVLLLLVRPLQVMAVAAELDAEAVLERLAPGLPADADLRVGMRAVQQRPAQLDVARHLVLAQEPLARLGGAVARDDDEERERLVLVADLAEERALAPRGARGVEVERRRPLDEAGE